MTDSCRKWYLLYGRLIVGTYTCLSIASPTSAFLWNYSAELHCVTEIMTGFERDEANRGVWVLLQLGAE